ncbi:glycosyltransferase [Algoriphagus limi]|uniref:Glycosyltransferase n=1 Tax=Algoriphagus limi TaxID=2975273 RepID=A0ABT2G2F0_9BACT|nr:glycosyltransferase [Algoriphagus limi]MCS5488978.1 glycosyltransferase [Algoriphagus limi]
MQGKKLCYVLCSDLPLPFEGIGSWTDEMNYFLKNTQIFDFILSPNPNSSGKYITCNKNQVSLVHRFLSFERRKSYIYRAYTKSLLEIGKYDKPLKILVIDDQGILKAIASIKDKLPAGSQIIYYFHGHLLNIPPSLMYKIDEVFFLTKRGYLESLSNSLQFTPEVKVLGNGVSSEIFNMLSQKEKSSQRKKMGFEEDDIIITWMANSRPVKGIHLFLKMLPLLLSQDKRIKILIIGTSNLPIKTPERVIVLGVLQPEELAKYLQISDFYFFTSLWKEGFGLSLVEAIKCGNFILCPKNGGIEEVTSDYSRKSFVEYPNILESWTSLFQDLLRTNRWKEIEPELALNMNKFYSLDSWVDRMEKALLEA